MIFNYLNIDGAIAEGIVHSQNKPDTVGIQVYNLLIHHGHELSAMRFEQLWFQSLKGSTLSLKSIIGFGQARGLSFAPRLKLTVLSDWHQSRHRLTLVFHNKGIWVRSALSRDRE